MRIILAAINAKYIHSNLAVYSLKAYAEKYRAFQEDISVAEYTINQQPDQILADLFARRPDVVCFSCYIWNITYVKELLIELKKVLPFVKLWLGGPEVSYNSVQFLEKYPQADGIIKGEGEETFLNLLKALHGEMDVHAVTGITYRDQGIRENPWRAPIDLNRIPFVYTREVLDDCAHKIIYYESSRGCPFSCSYCLSSVEKCLRFRKRELVFSELQFFIDHKISQVKFVDRTFNCNHRHAMAIWSYLLEHDEGTTNFHFEIAADLLREEELELLARMRPGLVQLEIGIQSTNPDTLREIQRTMDFERLSASVRRIHRIGNIHQHLDLIAGLPFEDYESFGRSFDAVFALRPEQLQLGFLKVLKGSRMYEKADEYGLVFQDRPPFEVLSTKWLSYEEIIRLKRVEEMTEVYYNSGQFARTLPELTEFYSGPFALFETLGNYYDGRGLLNISHNRIARYEILLEFIRDTLGNEKAEYFRERLIFDLYLRENVKSRPRFCGEPSVTKEEAAAFYDMEARERRYLAGYEKMERRQMRKMTHLERLQGKVYLFDYQNRNPFTNQAAVCEVNLTAVVEEL